MISVSRADQLQALVRGVDVLVIGGGITGAGVALDAADDEHIDSPHEGLQLVRA